jgi:hypothetical protein
MKMKMKMKGRRKGAGAVVEEEEEEERMEVVRQLRLLSGVGKIERRERSQLNVETGINN